MFNDYGVTETGLFIQKVLHMEKPKSKSKYSFCLIKITLLLSRLKINLLTWSQLLFSLSNFYLNYTFFFFLTFAESRSSKKSSRSYTSTSISGSSSKVSIIRKRIIFYMKLITYFFLHFRLDHIKMKQKSRFNPLNTLIVHINWMLSDHINMKQKTFNPLIRVIVLILSCRFRVHRETSHQNRVHQNVRLIKWVSLIYF